MSGWKARIGYYHLRFLTSSDWDLILPKGFTIVSPGLNDKAIDALGVGIGIFAAEQCDVGLMVVSHWEISVVTPPSNRRLRIVAASWFAGEHGNEPFRL